MEAVNLQREQKQTSKKNNSTFFKPAIQKKLSVGSANDSYEVEADQVADKVMKMSEPSPQTIHTGALLQRKCAACEEEEKLQMKPLAESISPLIQRSSSEIGGVAPSHVENQINSSRGGGSVMDHETKNFMESRFGTDFSNVKIHTGSEAVQMSRELNAQAFAVGNDIYFNEGKYNPTSDSGKHLLAHELTHTVQQTGGVGRKVQRFAHTTAASVDSLEIEQFESVRIPNSWNNLRAKLSQRDRLITQRLSLVASGSAEETLLLNMQSRWGTFRTLLSAPATNSATVRLPVQSIIDNAVADERSDRSALTGQSNRILRAAILEFISSLTTFLNNRETVADERIEYARFDTLFNDPQVGTLLSAISVARFTRADVKALISQETGDLTNTAVHGISSTKSGIRSNRRNGHGFVGLGQHSTSARDEAIDWANANGVTIAATPDPRRTPATSILLTAAYIGRTTDLLFAALPSNKPSGDELKKMVFASYNGGFRRVRDAANSFLSTASSRDYDWNDIKDEPRITGQMRNYVEEIVSRLT
ncbi:eCIS core domain-containing protein [Chryseobacterium gambrini]|uniref:eCIS core domain-containing protein n=1 Tax=Chryseobacterium gambrini TaxID=373672 RepID=UPI0022F14D94|nr:DUF4157 domain-containing protein [Chryseobacterium gambrini]WBV50734.1 DUF4157 domain-containing protein [Chryseobacterium gambrini]